MDITKIAIVGTGSMGSMLGLLFAEAGCQVSIFDPSTKNREAAIKHAKEAGYGDRITAYEDNESLCKSLGTPRVFVLSIPHGTVGDGVVDSLNPYLSQGDIIIDGANEHFLNTQRRQGKTLTRGVLYIGMGVSGGYQSARSGPSMSPSGDNKALDAVMPLLQKVAAKDSEGHPCVAKIGPGGSGHYVKMIHNGIEHGMMSALCEAWGIMNQLGMSYEEIASTWERWNDKGELSSNFLVSIGVSICRETDPSSERPLLGELADKVVQDVDDSEGTGTWTAEEGMRLHVPIPTIASAHQFRLASAYSVKRRAVHEGTGGLSRPESISLKGTDRDAFVEDLRIAVYASFLASFIQGLTLLAAASSEQYWDISFPTVISIWRGGCIIRSEYISSLLLSAYNSSDTNIYNPLASPKVAAEFKRTFPALKRVVAKAVETDGYVPALSSTLEYLKYESTKEDLPTEFMEAELDFFGAHNFELKGEDSGKPVTGPYHFGWKPAKGVPEPHKIVKS